MTLERLLTPIGVAVVGAFIGVAFALQVGQPTGLCAAAGALLAGGLYVWDLWNRRR